MSEVVSLSLNYCFIFLMMSPFSGWTTHQIVGPLNKKEVDVALVGFEIE